MRILFVLPDLPHPPFTGAHTRPLTLMRAAARRHELAAVGAAPADADLSVIRGALRRRAGGTDERRQARRHARRRPRQAAGHAGAAGQPRPLARARRAREGGRGRVAARRHGRRVVAVGPGGRDETGKLIPIDLKVGDKVLFGKWSGTEVKLDGEELLIMKESDIMGVIA